MFQPHRSQIVISNQPKVTSLSCRIRFSALHTWRIFFMLIKPFATAEVAQPWNSQVRNSSRPLYANRPPLNIHFAVIIPLE